MDLKKMQIAAMNLPELSGTLQGVDLNDPKVVLWFQNATSGIVDFDGYLSTGKGARESAEQRDMRMRDIDAYDGEIKNLVGLLKGFDSDLTSLTQWEVIVRIYNKINPIANILSGMVRVEEPSSVSNAEGSSASSESSIAGTSTEQVPNSTLPSSGNREIEGGGINNTESEEKKMEVPTQQVEIPVTQNLKPAEESKPKQTGNSGTSKQVVEKTESHKNDERKARTTQTEELEVPRARAATKAKSSKTKVSQPNVEAPTPIKAVEQSSIETKVSTPTEEAKESTSINNEKDGGKESMASTNTLNNLAARARGQQARGAQNTSKPETSNQYSEKALDAAKADMAAKTAWANANPVIKVITNAEPQALRIPNGSMGVLSVSGDGISAIGKLIGAFCKATGSDPNNLDNAILDKVHPDDMLKAKEVLNLLKEMNNAPNVEYPIFMPKPSYAIKGVTFGDGVPITNEEFIDILFTKGLGYAVTPGCIKNGVAILNAEGGASFMLDVAKVTTKNKNKVATAGDASKAGVQYKRVIRVNGRADFVSNPENVLVVYPTDFTDDPSLMKNVRVKAMIQKSDGSEMAASFRYQNGTKEVTRKSKDGVETKETVAAYKTFSVTLSTKAYITQSTPAPEFASIPAEKLTKFGNSVSQKSSNGKSKEIISTDNTADVEKYLQKSGLVKALSLAAAGAIKTTDESSQALINQVKAAGDNAGQQKAQQAAADAAADMGDDAKAAPAAKPAGKAKAAAQEPTDME